MFGKNERASLLFMAALTLGLVTITLWNVAATQAFSGMGNDIQLPEKLETTIFLAGCSILLSITLFLTVRQLVRKKPWHHFVTDGIFFALCIAGAAFIVYHNYDIKVSGSILNSLFNELSLRFELVTNPDLWSHSVADGLWSLNWIWDQALVLCLLTTSVFLIFPLARKAHQNGQKRWITPFICLDLLFALLVENLAHVYNFHKVFLPDNFYGLIALLWDATPFLGLSVLALVLLTRERSKPLPRKAWWVGLLITITLSLDLLAMMAEIREILANAIQVDPNMLFISMHFWPILPIAIMSALSMAILAMIVALVLERHTTRPVASLSSVNSPIEESAEHPEKKLGLVRVVADAEFEVEIIDL